MHHCTFGRWILLGLTFGLASVPSGTAAESASRPLEFKLQKRVESPPGSGEFRAVVSNERWDPRKTAIIVCDMWDLHHCKNAVKREAEFAPRMNALLEKSRASGAFIIHAPSNCMPFYAGHPARLRAQQAPRAANLPADIGEWCRKLPAEETVHYPLDDTPDESDDDPEEGRLWAEELAARGLNPKRPWTRQIDVLKIHDQDAITDSGVEVWNLLEARGITGVVLLGVHVNKCVTGRPFGLRQMIKNGRNAVLVRDLTDAMYNPKCWPYVDHYRGTELFLEHVEKHIGPTITSDQILGGSPFTFRGDPRAKTSKSE
jgi:nicotinamidase-related amidase